MTTFLRWFIGRGGLGRGLSILVLVGAFYALPTLPKQAYNMDEQTSTVVEVVTRVPGASAATVEELVTNVLEAELERTPDIEFHFSLTAREESRVTLVTENRYRAKILSAVNRILAKPSLFPPQAETPRVEILYEGAGVESLIVGVMAPTEALARKHALEVRTQLEHVSGVGRVLAADWPHGGNAFEERVIARVDPEKVVTAGITLSQIESTLREARSSRIGNGTSGPLSEGQAAEGSEKQRWAETISSTAIDGTDYRISDVATISVEPSPLYLHRRQNGKPVVTLGIYRSTSSLSEEHLVPSLYQTLDHIRKGLPEGVELTSHHDRFEMTEIRYNSAKWSALFGMIAVVMVVWWAMGFRVAASAGLGLMIAMSGTVLVLWYRGSSINMMTLAGWIMVLGILVDDTIVITESIVKARQEGKSAIEAVIEGTKRVAWPVTGALLTTMVVVLPLLFEPGKYAGADSYKDIALVFIIALGVKWFEAFLLLPSHLAHPNAISPRPKERMKVLGRAYASIVDHLVKFRFVVIAIAVAVATLGYMRLGHLEFQRDAETPAVVHIRLLAPEGSTIESMADEMRPFEERVAANEDVRTFETLIGSHADSTSMAFATGPRITQLKVFFLPDAETTRSTKENIERFRKEVADTLPGYKAYIVPDGMSSGNDSRDINVFVYPKSTEHLARLDATIRKVFSTFPELDNHTIGWFSATSRKKVRTNYSDEYTTDLQHEAELARAILLQDGTNVVSRTEDSTFLVAAVDESAALAFPIGEKQLGDLFITTDEEVLDPYVFHHHKGGGNYSVLRAQSISRDPAEVSKTRKAIIAALHAELSKTGDEGTIWVAETPTELAMAGYKSWAFLALLLIAGLLFVFIGRLGHTLVAVFAIPIGLGATLLILSFLLDTLEGPMVFGLVCVMGVLVNDSMVFIERFHEIYTESGDLLSSLRSTAQDRLRSIVLTSMTTAVGVLPASFAVTGRDYFIGPMAIAVAIGVTVSLFTTLLTLPALLYVAEEVSRGVRFVANKLPFKPHGESGAGDEA